MPNYLYNSVELPELPEWDKEVYPYAFITHSRFDLAKTDTYTLTLWPFMFTALNEDFSGGWELLADGAAWLTATFVVTNSEPQSAAWSALKTNETLGAGMLGTVNVNGEAVGYSSRLYTYDDYSGSIIWSNHSFYGPNGESWITASDPVPVGGEPEEPEEPETPTLTNRDLYRTINGKPVKLTLYKKVDGELVKVDEHTT